jgi:hypothetical protein
MRGNGFTKISLAVGAVALLASSVSAETTMYHSVEQSSNSSGGGSVSNYSSSTVNINSSSSSSVSQSSSSSSSSSDSSSHSSSRSTTTTIRNGKMVTVTKVTGEDGKTTETTTEAPTDSNVNVTIPGSNGTEQSLIIRSKPGGGFEITQDGVTVSTGLPLQVNSDNTQLQVSINNSLANITLLPADAANTLKQFGKFSDIKQFQLTNNGGLNYTATGDSNAKLFGLIPIHIPITVSANASTSGLKIVNQPWYLQRLGFLFR